jgi:hypothetical protein
MGGQGGLLQLVATGKQDVFLTGNPQMTWFKMVYRRYTNFAMESQPMYFDGTPDFGKRITCLIPRRGDLLGQIILEVELPALKLTTGQAVAYVNSIGHALIQEITVEVGEQEIDRQNGEWMEIMSSYTTTSDKQTGFYNMIGKIDGYSPNTLEGPLKLYIPLRFWFCRNPGLALPLLALQYHPVRINLTLRPLSQLYYTPLLTSPTCTLLEVEPAKIDSLMLWGDYVHLDVEERRRFVSNTHEYLIEQVQYTAPLPIAPGATSATLQMEFNHPIRELFWYIQRDDMARYHEYFNYSSIGTSEAGTRQDMMQDAVLQFDGFDRFQLRDAGYFRLVQPWQHHTVVPEDFFVYSYSFAIRPEDVQPCGSVNASRLDSMILQINLNPDVVKPPKVSTGVFTVGAFFSGVTSLTFLLGSTPVVGASLSANGIANGTLIRSYNPVTKVMTISLPTLSSQGYTEVIGSQESPVFITQTQASECIVGTLHSRIYAINHNVFRIADGFGGVLFTI